MPANSSSESPTTRDRLVILTRFLSDYNFSVPIRFSESPSRVQDLGTGCTKTVAVLGASYGGGSTAFKPI